MTEYYTEAIVLDKTPSSEVDALILLYTKDLGRIRAKAKSVKKITSKLSAHLEPLNLIKVRLIETKGGTFQVVDALSLKKYDQQALDVLETAKRLTFDLHPDEVFWDNLVDALHNFKSTNSANRLLLKALGVDPALASCSVCASPTVSFFVETNYSFLCSDCIKVKINQNQTR